MKIPLSDKQKKNTYSEIRFGNPRAGGVPAHFARIRHYLGVVLSAISFPKERVDLWAPSWPNALHVRHLVKRAVSTNMSIYLHSNTWCL